VIVRRLGRPLKDNARDSRTATGVLGRQEYRNILCSRQEVLYLLVPVSNCLSALDSLRVGSRPDYVEFLPNSPWCM
jgi:hypothetical protein